MFTGFGGRAEYVNLVLLGFEKSLPSFPSSLEVASVVFTWVYRVLPGFGSGRPECARSS